MFLSCIIKSTRFLWVLPSLVFAENVVIAQPSNSKVNKSELDEKSITLFSGQLSQQDRKNELLKTLSSASEFGIDSVDVRFSEKLNRTVCCYNPKNYMISDHIHCDQDILIVTGEKKPMPDQTTLEFINNMPYDRTAFKKHKCGLDIDIRGSNNITPFHTTISNHQIVCSSVCELIVQLPAMATADSVAVMRFLDNENKQRTSLIVLRYDNQRLSKDDLLVKFLGSKNVVIGDNLAFFVFHEPKRNVTNLNSGCLKYVEEFVESKRKADYEEDKGTGFATGDNRDSPTLRQPTQSD